MHRATKDFPTLNEVLAPFREQGWIVMLGDGITGEERRVLPRKRGRVVELVKDGRRIAVTYPR